MRLVSTRAAKSGSARTTSSGATERMRPDGLHCRVVLEVDDCAQQIVERRDARVGKARIAVEGRNDDVAVACEELQRVDVVAGNGAAAEAVREQQHGKPRAIRRKDRRLPATLHPRHDLAVGQRVVRVVVRRRRRIADEVRVGDRPVAKIAVQLAIVRQRDVDDERVRGVHEKIGDIAGAAAAAAFPVRRRVAAHHAREVLLDVAAADRIRSRRKRRNDAEDVVERLCVSARHAEQQRGGAGNDHPYEL